ncbi:MAG: hypothetical protein M3M88_06380 [Thermoproteota archaeon]|nr:hypothetical protein [Thermoproteota archaeon]
MTFPNNYTTVATPTKGANATVEIIIADRLPFVFLLDPSLNLQEILKKCCKIRN